MKSVVISVGMILLFAIVTVTVMVESESIYRHEALAEGGSVRALILYHPSRDAQFSDDLSMALADGLRATGFSVHRATLTIDTPPVPEGYQLIAIVSNTYWWRPDLPTLRYLKHARLNGVNAIGVIGGAGATERSMRMLDDALRKTGANVVGTRSFWLLRPNDDAHMSEPNRQVALQLARQFAVETGQATLTLTKSKP